MRLQKNILEALLLVVVTGLIVVAYAKGEKIAVAAAKSDQESAISEVAGRATYFLFFDANGGFLEAVENPFKNLPGGAGQEVAAFLAKKGATHVIAEQFGFKMEQALKSYHIEYREQTGVVNDVVQKLLKSL